MNQNSFELEFLSKQYCLKTVLINTARLLFGRIEHNTTFKNLFCLKSPTIINPQNDNTIYKNVVRILKNVTV